MKYLALIFAVALVCACSSSTSSTAPATTTPEPATPAPASETVVWGLGQTSFAIIDAAGDAGTIFNSATRTVYTASAFEAAP
jgi:hypothetical protein